MTWRLVVGQLRAHRGYFAWTATLLAVLVAILTFIGTAGATQGTLDQQASTLLDRDAERHGFVTVTSTPVGGLEYNVSAEQLREMIDANASASAVATAFLTLEPFEAIDPYDWRAEIWAHAAYGGTDRSAFLTEGRMPERQGEIALSADVAAALHARLGDEVTLYGQRTGPDGFAMDVPYTFTVVGFSVDRRLPGYDFYQAPGALLSWDEVERASAFSQPTWREGFEGIQVAPIDVQWDGASSSLDRYLSYEAFTESPLAVALPQSTAVWLVVAVVLIIAMIVMSFSVGRGQAAARTQWIATVRTMGATRRYIAAATVLETLAIALVAAVVGIVVGLVAAQTQLAVARASVGAPFGPATVSVYWPIFPVVALVALVVALLIAAVPAFWASRVNPVAALKPVNDVTETELSRRVSPHWLWLPLVVGVALIVLGSWQPTAPMDVVIVLGMIIGGMALAGLAIEANRWGIPRVGRRLARSSKRARITAGDELSIRPKQAVAPAILTTAAVGTLTVMTTVAALDPRGMVRVFGHGYTEYGDYTDDLAEALNYWWHELVSPTAVVAVVLAAVAIQLVAASMFVAHRAVTAREGATRRALGLSASELARAHWWQQWTPQVTGAAIGLGGGLLVAEAWRLLNILNGADGYDTMPAALRLLALLAVLGAIAIMLSAGALTAWAVAAAGSRSTPLGQALRAH